MEKFLICANGNAVNWNFIKKIYVLPRGFGPDTVYNVLAVISNFNNKETDDWETIEVFKNKEDAYNFIKELVNHE